MPKHEDPTETASIEAGKRRALANRLHAEHLLGLPRTVATATFNYATKVAEIETDLGNEYYVVEDSHVEEFIVNAYTDLAVVIKATYMTGREDGMARRTVELSPNGADIHPRCETVNRTTTHAKGCLAYPADTVTQEGFEGTVVVSRPVNPGDRCWRVPGRDEIEHVDCDQHPDGTRTSTVTGRVVRKAGQ